MVKVNNETCIGCGLCESICPKVFEMDDDFKAKVKSNSKPSCLKDAIESCPVDAIRE